MENLKKTVAEMERVIGRKIAYAEEQNAPLEEGRTYFRFTANGVRYVGSLEGTDAATSALAALLPAHLEGAGEMQTTLSKTQFFKKVLTETDTTALVYQYAKKYAVQDVSCFVAVVETPKMADVVASLSTQYSSNDLDVCLVMEDGRVAVVRFCARKEEVSSISYAEYLAQFIKEELGLDVRIGVGSTVSSLVGAADSYTQALSALRYAEALKEEKSVHAYKDFLLIKMLEDLPRSKMQEYYALLSRTEVKEIFDDEEMMSTAKEFLRGNLNVSETARSMYLHRNTLSYRLDKIERMTGLNIRNFADAQSFHILSLLHALLRE